MSDKGAIEKLHERLQHDGRAVAAPKRTSFEEFLLKDARVRSGGGQYGPYTLDGREALIEPIRTIDQILGSATGKPLKDARLAIAGGAQFGKTILELNFSAYITAVLFRNVGLYLPDDDLVQGIVDTKFRPDVVDQIEWFADMVNVGKTVNKSGKTVHRKGAFMVTDGQRRAEGMIRGLGKVPTTFSMDVALMDEVDDINPRMAKFVKGRLTASDLRCIVEIGTQRIHGRGMNARWKSGSQGVVRLDCAGCGRASNPEEDFPAIIRLAIDGMPKRTDPMLSHAADFVSPTDGRSVAGHEPLNPYYLACPECGTPLNRRAPRWEHLAPGQITKYNWSFRIAQLSIDAIDLSQIVAGWATAVEDPEAMIVFMCDVLANPKSTSQKITPEILTRAKEVAPYDMLAGCPEGRTAYGGMDLGDMCWMLARETGGEHKRIICAEKFPAGDMVQRAVSLFHRCRLTALFLDQRPNVNEARSIALTLNGLQGLEIWPRIPEGRGAWLGLPGGLTWDGENERWLNLKCAVVRFDAKKPGAGIKQGFDRFEQEGQTRFVPLISCNRFESIDRVVREFLTPAENVVEVVGGKVRETPAMLLPRRLPGGPPILETLEAHIVTGSERGEDPDGSLGDYVDKCANHLLLADAYGGLAELVVAGSANHKAAPPMVFDSTRRTRVLTDRRDRTVMA